ncbi:P-loop containing nucleoside triphosphate hydrolase protein [Aulographum hederae CBS 113979]|uniref:DNA repair protein RAD51 homolog 3 n=1 Tax=Aulographum hederae CBS 113979 TaxID=1176131 RepID=A0A6G1GPN4_9PEZI|nr:P-loop containing nucleoside triphosphate hydrolase protein [Aulographum hederae CBS 113979]
MSSQNVHNLPSSSSSHRLPTVSATQALLTLKANVPRAISTGLPRLDSLLSGNGVSTQQDADMVGGLVRGQITEVYGPPGVGKTTFCMQASASALKAGERVIWVDCGSPLVPRRFGEIFKAANEHVLSGGKSPTPEECEMNVRENFKYQRAHSLALILAMFMHSSSEFPPQETSLIIIDSLSTVFDTSYQKNNEIKSNARKDDALRWASGRRFAVMSDLISNLGKMATTRNIAVVLTCQTVTRMRSGSNAVLLPALSSVEWDNGISTQLVLFRDWPPAEKKGSVAEKERWNAVRFVGAIKVGGQTLADNEGVGTVVPFTVEKSGLSELRIESSALSVPPLSSPMRGQKRPFEEISDPDVEDVGSENDYGWVEEDQVAAEGLLIEDPTLPIDLTKPPHTEHTGKPDTDSNPSHQPGT